MATEKATSKKRTSNKKASSIAAKSKSATKKSLLSDKIAAEQWDLPAGFKEDGNTLATLREVVNPSIPTLSLPDLPMEKRKKLVVERLERKPNFTINMIGSGVVDKARAIEEVKSQTPAGKVIQEIEQRVINNMLKKAKL